MKCTVIERSSFDGIMLRTSLSQNTLSQALQNGPENQTQVNTPEK